MSNMQLESIVLPGVDPKRPIVIAGPCSAETEEQVMETAREIAAQGIKMFRAGIWKPRTKPGGFEGVGAVGLSWLKRVKRETGLYTATEVATREHVFETLKAGIDIRCVFDSFLQKRESWLSLRGFSSQAQVVTSITTQEKQGEFTASDECHLMLSLEKTSKIQERGLFPYDYKLYYSNLVSGKKWTYTSNRNTGETNFSGDKIGVAKPKELVELLTLPLDFYWSMTNVNMQNALSLWNVVIEKGSLLSYCFEPIGKMNSEKMLPAKICFKDGNLSEFQSKRKTGIPFAITTYEKYVLSNGFLFPTLISLHFDKNGGNMENDMKLSISLSDLNVV